MHGCGCLESSGPTVGASVAMPPQRLTLKSATLEPTSVTMPAKYKREGASRLPAVEQPTRVRRGRGGGRRRQALGMWVCEGAHHRSQPGHHNSHHPAGHHAPTISWPGTMGKLLLPEGGRGATGSTRQAGEAPGRPGYRGAGLGRLLPQPVPCCHTPTRLSVGANSRLRETRTTEHNKPKEEMETA